MSFLYPAFLLGAVAVAIPIVLHLLRRDIAPEVPFTAVRLLLPEVVVHDPCHAAGRLQHRRDVIRFEIVEVLGLLNAIRQHVQQRNAVVDR